MDYNFHYLLMITHALFQKKVMAALSRSNLTAGQPKVLDFLGLHDGSVQKSIAEGCQIDPATLTGVLNRMEEKNLIIRKSQNGDRRSLHVYLTELGWEKQEKVREQLISQASELLSSISCEQRELLLKMLYSLCEAMVDPEVLQ